jgi:hypothetical protein
LPTAASSISSCRTGATKASKRPGATIRILPSATGPSAGAPAICPRQNPLWPVSLAQHPNAITQSGHTVGKHARGRSQCRPVEAGHVRDIQGRSASLAACIGQSGHGQWSPERRGGIEWASEAPWFVEPRKCRHDSGCRQTQSSNIDSHTIGISLTAVRVSSSNLLAAYIASSVRQCDERDSPNCTENGDWRVHPIAPVFQTISPSRPAICTRTGHFRCSMRGGRPRYREPAWSAAYPPNSFRLERRPAKVAVGTEIAPRPPHRSVRAAFPHTAPTSGE